MTYCHLLAWEAESPRTFWGPIPTRIDIVEILTDLCRDELQYDVQNADNDVDFACSDGTAAGDPQQADTGRTGMPLEREAPAVRSITQNEDRRRYSFEPADKLAVRPRIRAKGVKRRLSEPTSPPASKRQAPERETQVSGESQHSKLEQDTPDQDIQNLVAKPSPNSKQKVQSFKEQHRRPENRAPTPPRRAYEALSPPPSPIASMAPTSMP